MKTPKKTIPEFVQRAESMLPMFTTSSNRPQPTADLPREICRAASRRWRLFPVPDYYRYAPMKVRLNPQQALWLNLELWASENSGCNWGLVTGQASEVFALSLQLVSADLRYVHCVRMTGTMKRHSSQWQVLGSTHSFAVQMAWLIALDRR